MTSLVATKSNFIWGLWLVRDYFLWKTWPLIRELTVLNADDRSDGTEMCHLMVWLDVLTLRHIDHYVRGVVARGGIQRDCGVRRKTKALLTIMLPGVRRPTLDADWSACSSIDFRLEWAAVQTKPLVLSCLASDRLINVKSSLVLCTKTHIHSQSRCVSNYKYINIVVVEFCR